MTSVLDVLNQHMVFLSDEDEEAIDKAIYDGTNAADLALRTCLCGARLNGFDEYHQHLREAIERTIE